jgi:hypothetical protein
LDAIGRTYSTHEVDDKCIHDLKDGDRLGDVRLDGSIIFIQIVRYLRRSKRRCTEIGQRPGAGSREFSNEILGFMKLDTFRETSLQLAST